MARLGDANPKQWRCVYVVMALYSYGPPYIVMARLGDANPRQWRCVYGHVCRHVHGHAYMGIRTAVPSGDSCDPCSYGLHSWAITA